MRKDAPKRVMGRELLIWVSLGGLFIGQIVLCIVAFNWAGQNVIMYLGWAMLGAAYWLGWRARVAFEAKGGAGEGERWLETRNLVDSGIYAVVRHPMYLCFMLVIISLMMISQHWLSIVLGIPILTFFYFAAMVAEEKNNLRKFGDVYQDYMKRVPRMNIVLGIIRTLRKKHTG